MWWYFFDDRSLYVYLDDAVVYSNFNHLLNALGFTRASVVRILRIFAMWSFVYWYFDGHFCFTPAAAFPAQGEVAVPVQGEVVTRYEVVTPVRDVPAPVLGSITAKLADLNEGLAAGLLTEAEYAALRAAALAKYASS